MNLPVPFVVRRAVWATDSLELAGIRRAVFVGEQGVSESEEWDGLDASCQHVMALTLEGVPMGTGRLVPAHDGVPVAHIGRMAVLKAWRGRGVGSALLVELIGLAREGGHAEVRLHAQTHAMGFYRRHGYVALGEEFLEAGIPHYEMRLGLKP